MRPKIFARAALLAVPLLIATPSVAAADPGLGLSTDGHTWSSTLSGPLFDEDARIVPGGRTHAQLWARNSSPHWATLTVVSRDIRSTLPAGVAARDDFLVRVGGIELPGEELGGCHVLATHVLDSGQRYKVPMSGALPATSRNISQDEALSLSLQVGIVQGEGSDPCDDDDPADPTPPNGEPTPPGGEPTPPGDGPTPDGPDSPGSALPGGPTQPPETPGWVQTDGGPGALGVLPDVVGLGLLALVAAAALRRVRPAIERFALRRREREQSGRPAS